VEFFDKKQEVLDVKLTRYGRHLLSRGKFKPVYYCFSDDEVIYDQRWISGTLAVEEQSMVEQRIQKDTPQLKVLNSKTNTEVAVFNNKDFQQFQNLNDLYNINISPTEFAAAHDTPKKATQEATSFLETLQSINLNVNFADAEKLIQSFLGTKRHFTKNAPAWNVLFYNGTITESSASYHKSNITTMIPQIKTTLTDVFYGTAPGQNAFKVYPQLQTIITNFNKQMGMATETDYSSVEQDYFSSLVSGDDSFFSPQEEYFYNFFNQAGFQDGTGFLIKKDFLFVSFEEAHVDVLKDNFTLEVFEVVDDPHHANTEQLRKLSFYQKSGVATLASDAVEAYFDIQVDTEISRILGCSLINNERNLKTQNIYTTNVFECAPTDTQKQYESTDPYDLPPVKPEDVC
jgi:hypothetical protein